MSGYTLISDKHLSALAKALSEILATADGKSDQSIKDIVTWCLSEIDQSPSPVPIRIPSFEPLDKDLYAILLEECLEMERKIENQFASRRSELKTGE